MSAYAVSIFRCPDFQRACYAARVLALNCGCEVEISREYDEATDEISGWFISFPTANECLPTRHIQIICGEIEEDDESIEPEFYEIGPEDGYVYEEESEDDRRSVDFEEDDEQA